MILAEPQTKAQRPAIRPRSIEQGPSDEQLRQLAMEIIRLDPSLARQLEQSGQRRLAAGIA